MESTNNNNQEIMINDSIFKVKTINIIIYRPIQNGNEILFKKCKNDEKFSLFSSVYDETVHPNFGFCATSTILSDLINFQSKYTETYFFYEEKDYQKLLGKINVATEVIESQDFSEYTYILCYPQILEDYSQKLNSNNMNFEWVNCNDVLTKITNETQKKLQQITKNQELNQFIKACECQENKKKFAILSVDEREVITNVYDGLYVGILRKQNQKWEIFNMWEFQYPQDINSYQGFIIGGSYQSAYDKNIPWFEKFYAWLKQLLMMKKKPQILGVCFGAQAIAQAYGGQVQKMNNCYQFLNNKVVLDSKFLQLKYVQESKIFKNNQLLDINLSECHQDEVIVLPTNATLYGSSADTKTEIYGLNEDVLAFQSHPEYLLSYMKPRIPKYFGKISDQTVQQAFKKSLYDIKSYSKEILYLCHVFLNQ